MKRVQVKMLCSANVNTLEDLINEFLDLNYNEYGEDGSAFEVLDIKMSECENCNTATIIYKIEC